MFLPQNLESLRLLNNIATNVLCCKSRGYIATKYMSGCKKEDPIATKYFYWCMVALVVATNVAILQPNTKWMHGRICYRNQEITKKFVDL